MAFKIPVSKRTEGDGMEHDVVTEADRPLISCKPGIPPIRKISPTVPKIKEPKFVPFEPYKAAVRPLVPVKKYKMPKLGAGEKEPPCKRDDSESKCQSSSLEKEPKDGVDEHYRKLKLENEELEKQLELQVQVNGELKNLLVAAVGEDMETRVNCLAEDKQHLAQKLISAAKNLSTHQEQVEWLANQCEVWRSKFLASSVMVEELAKWKASLSQKIATGETIMKQCLNDSKVTRRNLLDTYSNLSVLHGNFDLLNKRSALKTSNILDLSSECADMSKGLVVQLLGGKPIPVVDVGDLPIYTEAESAAEYMLTHPYQLDLIGEPDAVASTVVGVASALQSQIYHEKNPPRISCCNQCTGHLKLV